MLLEQFDRVRNIDRLIRLHNTGNADEFAQKLNISRRQIYNILEEFKSLGLCISYNRSQRSFVYDRPYQIDISFNIRELADEDMQLTKGGMIFCGLFVYGRVSNIVK